MFNAIRVLEDSLDSCYLYFMRAMWSAVQAIVLLQLLILVMLPKISQVVSFVNHFIMGR